MILKTVSSSALARKEYWLSSKMFINCAKIMISDDVWGAAVAVARTLPATAWLYSQYFFSTVLQKSAELESFYRGFNGDVLLDRSAKGKD